MGVSPPPELSVVVPVLNEAAALPELFTMLAEQEGVFFDLLLCDGGSCDGTPEMARVLAGSAPFPSRILVTRRGRGRQMNVGASAATASTLLFLHADSRFPDSDAFRIGLEALRRSILARGNDRVAGRFSLRFRRSSGAPSAPYSFYEEKARLDRAGCIHGDQGFLLRRSFFEEVGSYDENLSLLEDDDLAERVRRCGQWLLLPAEIETSARRFETEGLLARQTLNALIMNLASIGWREPLESLPDLYRSQDRAVPLNLLPFFEAIAELLAPLPLLRRVQLWYRTGAYVRANAWQLAFALDQRFREKDSSAGAPSRFLRHYDRWLDPLIDHAVGRAAAAALTWGWFHGVRRALRRNRGTTSPLQGR